MNELIYPWQLAQWKRLCQANTAQRLPHALILTGMAGSGKSVFADALARLLLCQTPDILDQRQACDCQSCHLTVRRIHPDAMWIEPEKPRQAIKVDQVREIAHFINQSSMGELNRVVVIHPADAMNINAANALLKTLEEPSKQAYLILVCDQMNGLPATIHSRCQRVHFPRPDKAIAATWLQKVSQISEQEADLSLRLAHGAPCAANVLLQNDSIVFRRQLVGQLSGVGKGVISPISVAAGIKEVNYNHFIDVMLSWLLDLTKLQLGAGFDDVINIDHLPELLAMKDKIQINVNLQLVRRLQELIRAMQLGLNFNKQLMMENVLICWARSLARSKAA